MFIDSQLLFSDSQAITATADSTNIIDASAIRNLGVGEPLFLVFVVTVAFTDSGSDSTVTPSLQTDDNAGFSSAATIRTYDVFAALTAKGTQRVYHLEPFTKAGLYEQFLKVVYTLANGSLTTGSISAFITDTAQLDRIYPSGWSVA